MPRAHRETQLLLSIIYAFLGEAESAFQAAAEGSRRGVELNSPFITAVGHMRQGHSLMLLPGEGRFEEAQKQFQKTIELGRTLTIPRLGIEANWGLCRVYGYRGDLEKAREVALSGIQLATQYGDEWIASLIRLAMGASMVLAGRYESSHDWLKMASQGFQECADPFGVAGAHLWRCLAYFHQGETRPAFEFFPGGIVDLSKGGV